MPTNNCGKDRLFDAAARSDLAEVKRLLIDCGLDPNVRNNDGWTPLHSAAYRCHIDVARVLLDRGADPTIRDNNGRTPLEIGSKCKGLIEELRRRDKHKSGGTTVYE
jgi:ankyrin repeat protein